MPYHVPATAQPAAGDYLSEVAAETRDLPEAVRHDLLDDLAAHIDAAYLDHAPTDPSPRIEQILDDLGSPGEIADSARRVVHGADSQPRQNPNPESPTPENAAPENPAPVHGGAGYDGLALLALTVGLFAVPLIGWLAGLVMVWLGPRWGRAERLLATALWPVIVAVPLSLATLAPDPIGKPAAVIALLALLLTWLPFVVWRLIRTSALTQLRPRRPVEPDALTCPPGGPS